METKIKNILKHINLNPFAQCRRYNLRLLQCPSFLFFLMGLLTLLAMVGTYLIAKKYYSSEVVIGSVSTVTILIFSLGNLIIKGIEKITATAIIKAEFISIVSHQLKAPLANLKWPLELLLSGKIGNLNEKQLSYLKLIQENNERMIKLINDLLDVSKIEDGRMKIIKQNVDLKEIVRSVVDNFIHLAKASNISISLNIENNLPLIKTDSNRVRLAIQNLVDNAVKYNKPKGKIEIDLKRMKNRIYFSIKDTGVGIPKEQQKQIFSKFFRSDNVLKHQTQGTGLGLYITKAIIKSSGGKIGFTSEENKGTTFWFYLPTVSAETGR